MIDKDTIIKEYMQNKERFADVFNFYLYDSEPKLYRVVRESDL